MGYFIILLLTIWAITVASMKIMRQIILFFLVLLNLWIPPVSHATEACDSLIQLAIKASIEKKYQYSLELFSQAKLLAIHEKSPKKLFCIYLNIGINKAELLDYNDALNHFFEAYKIAVDKLDKRQEMSIFFSIFL